MEFRDTEHAERVRKSELERTSFMDENQNQNSIDDAVQGAVFKM